MLNERELKSNLVEVSAWWCQDDKALAFEAKKKRRNWCEDEFSLMLCSELKGFVHARKRTKDAFGELKASREG